MLFFAEMLMLAGAFGLAAVIAEQQTYSVGQHIGSAMALAIVSNVAQAGLWSVLEADAGWETVAVSYLTLGVISFLVTQVFARLFYSASGREAQLMAITVGVCHPLIAGFLRWAVSS